jgi:hypothetical protein
MMLTEKLQKLSEIMNSLFSVFHHFVSICLYSVKFKNIWFIIIQFQGIQ